MLRSLIGSHFSDSVRTVPAIRRTLMSHPKTFGATIRRARNRKNLTTRELSATIGKSRQWISLVERGTNHHAHIVFAKSDEPERKENPTLGLIELAKRIQTGESDNYGTRNQWFAVLSKMSEAQRQRAVKAILGHAKQIPAVTSRATLRNDSLREEARGSRPC